MPHSLFNYIVNNQLIAALVILGVGWLLLEIKGILVIFFISYILMASLLPLIGFLRKKGIPRVFAVLISYLVTLTFLVLLIFPLVPFFVAQIQTLFAQFPLYFNQVARVLGIDVDSAQLRSLVSSELDLIGQNVFVVTSRIFGGLFSVVTVFVISFYLLLEHEQIKEKLVAFFPKHHRQKALATFVHVEEKLGAWLRGQIILSVFIGFVTWVVLVLLGIDFALPLALIAGVLEVIPTIGPILSAVPAVILALTSSPAKVLLVIVAYVGIQMLENNLLVPKIMQKAVGLNPIIVIIGIMIGSRLMGVLGALLSVPFMAMLIIIFHSFRHLEEKEQ